MRNRGFLVWGLIVALVLGGGIALFASSNPDGLESAMLDGCELTDDEITGGECIAQSEGEHEVGGPMADYGLSFLGENDLAASLSGLLGVLLAMGAATGLFWLLAKRPKDDAAAATDPKPARAEGE
ncbi:PDGLE domain-containing protein [Salininema proteolyticum]|uniref:PDGLE domain-containing protein n=1 Tax=Salininema proteolyticum TaxID=1607685 RepID=A0ABV8TZ99_9ACTN